MIYYRQGLFVALLFISGVSALAVATIAKKLNQKASRKAMISGTLYGTIMTVTYPRHAAKTRPDIDIVESD